MSPLGLPSTNCVEAINQFLKLLGSKRSFNTWVSVWKNCLPSAYHSILPQMTEEERLAYYQEACKRGLESRLIPPFFTCIGKMKVLAKAALLMLIVMMMLAIVGALISAAFLTLIGLSAGFYFLCTYLVSFLNCIIDTIIWTTFSFE